jgi:membrane protease YdiL (CAAX protease family)
MTAVRRHPVGAYLAVVYGLGVLIYALPLLGSTGLKILPIELPGVEPFILVSAIMLTVAAFAVTAATDGRAGVRELRGRAFRFRVSPLWYLASVLLLPLSALGVALVVAGADPLAAIIGQPAVIVDWLLAIVVLFLLVNLWEEIGWTGFVLHRLQPRVGPVPATVLTTWAQATLHLPLLFVIGGVSDDPIAPAQYPLYLAALYLLPLGNRTALTWLYNQSGQSLPVTGLAHSSFNLANGTAFLPFLVAGLDGVWAYAGFAAVALVLIVATRGRLGYAAPSAAESAAAAGLGSREATAG